MGVMDTVSELMHNPLPEGRLDDILRPEGDNPLLQNGFVTTSMDALSIPAAGGVDTTALIVGSFAGYLVGAWLSDKIGRRKLMIIGSVGYLVSLGLLAALGLAVLDGGGTGCRARGLVALRLALLQPVAVVLQVAVEGLDPAVGDDPEAVHRRAQQMPVVGHQQHAAGEFRQRARQGFAGVHVQVVAGFVEQQQVRFLPNHQSQGKPRLFPA